MGNRSCRRIRIVRLVVWSLMLGTAAPVMADDIRIPNNYHAQETTFFCGPASVQMMLDTPAVLNNYVNPILPTQTTLYNIGQLNNIEPWFMSPSGMVAALNISDGAFHNYAFYATPNLNVLSRTIASALKDFGVPGSVLIKGGQHWVDINRVETTGVIGPGAYTINKFYGRDPWPVRGTLGQNFELAYNANPRSPWARLVTPVSGGTVWRNQRVAVLEPQGPETIDPGAFDSTPAAPAQLANELLLPGAITDAVADVAADPVLSGLNEFHGTGSFNASDSVLDHYASDPANEGDWVIPFETSPGVITGSVSIDADTGQIDYAMWSDPGSSMTVGDFGNFYSDIFTDSLVNDSGEFNVPEPGSLLLLGLGAGSLLKRRHR